MGARHHQSLYCAWYRPHQSARTHQQIDTYNHIRCKSDFLTIKWNFSVLRWSPFICTQNMATAFTWNVFRIDFPPWYQGCNNTLYDIEDGNPFGADIWSLSLTFHDFVINSNEIWNFIWWLGHTCSKSMVPWNVYMIMKHYIGLYIRAYPYYRSCSIPISFNGLNCVEESYTYIFTFVMLPRQCSGQTVHDFCHRGNTPYLECDT